MSNDLKVTFVPGLAPRVAGDFGFVPAFRVYRENQYLCLVLAQLDGAIATIVLRNLGGTDQEDRLCAALVETVLERLHRHLAAADVDNLFGSSAEVVWRLDREEDGEELLRRCRTKTCSYQLRDGRDLLCGAASPSDDTAVAASGRQTFAPTSSAICKACDLPPTPVLCSALLHPKVRGYSTLGAPPRRQVVEVFCDQGNADVGVGRECRPGGKECWHVSVAVQQSATEAVISPLVLAEAFDFLDAQWRLAFGRDRALLSVSTVSEATGIAAPCGTREQFESRMSDLTDLVARMVVADDLLPQGDRPTGSLNRIESSLRAKLSGEGFERAASAIRKLRRVQSIRTALQHSGAAPNLPRALRDLGIDHMLPDWSALWARIMTIAYQALRDLRSEVRAIPDE